MTLGHKYKDDHEGELIVNPEAHWKHRAEKAEARVKELYLSKESPIVSFQTVGEKNMMHNPHARTAVNLKVTKDEFIRHLLKVNDDLQNSIIEKLQITPFTAKISIEEQNDE